MNMFKKVLLVIAVATIALAAIPARSAFAAGLADTPAPTLGLEWAFLREKNRVGQIGLAIQNSDATIALVQELIDQAKANGKDVSSVQAALDALKAAIKTAQPFYDQAKSVVDAHTGFDSQGKVTDAEAAKQTVKSAGEALKQYHTAMGGTRKALGEAVRQFRQDNPRRGQNSKS